MKDMSWINNKLEPLFQNKVSSHLLFWVSIVLLLSYHGSLFGGTWKDNLINMLTILPIQMMASYSLIYWLMPKFLYRRQWIVFGLLLGGLAYLFSVLGRLSIIHIAEPLIGAGEYDESIWEIVNDPVYLIRVYLSSIYLPAIIFFMVKMTKERFVNQNKLDFLEKEKRNAELNFLKAQMNPHFLFNTLNNIYALSRQKSELTSDMILKFSDILDYTIYECQADTVSISKEWELIENYADLETLRFNKPVHVVLNNKIENPDNQIAPLILITLVENAFKYALKNPSEQPLIKIDLEESNRQITMTTFNSKGETVTEVKSQKGIGIQNLRRQLNLIYNKKHELKILDTLDTYTTKLTIQLQ